MSAFFERKKWEGSLNSISRLSQSHSIHLILFDKNMVPLDGIATSTMFNEQDSINADQELKKYLLEDPRILNSNLIESGDVVNHESLFLQHSIEKTRLFSEFLVPYKSEHQAVARLETDYGSIMLSVIRGKNIGSYSANELAQIKSFLPLLKQSIDLNIAITNSQNIGGAYEALLHQDGVGVFFLGYNMEIIETNQAVLKMLDDDSFLKVGGRLVIKSNRGDLLSDLFNKTKDQDNSPSYFYSKDAESIFKLVLKPISLYRTEGEIPVKYILFVRQGGNEFGYLIMKSDFKLTESEAKLVIFLASGESLNTYSSLNALSINTVRWTLKNIFSKTDTKSQNELLSLINAYSF